MTDIVVPTTIDPLPPPPQPSDTPAQFDAKSFASLDAQVAMVEQVNESNAKTYQNAIATHERAVAANASALSAAGSASAAAASAGATQWQPGTAYADGAVVWSPVTYQTYRRMGAGSGTVDPSVDTAAWAPQHIGVGAKGATDLNTLVVPGMYTFAGAGNAPAGVTGGVVYVARDGGVLGQMIVDVNGSTFSRGATGIGGSPTFSPWRRCALHDDVVVPLAGGDIDCAKGNYFTETVNGARTLAFSNAPAGAYSCVLEINHVSGTLTMPAGTVWAGPVPTLATGKRHLIFFQRAQLGTAGWYASALAGYSA